ncbi:hypothetical protein FRUB_03333 [Fimbriiglobus ruber]|uniref:Glycosyltransferase RgtA/B/C/D-like domain-containing protein n=2 Tax=Fimbriiglobus ruber TaxID=1908690 RepID=A0A225DVZ6_9BACT|nr:hypothetical protein FRUB_03333 [Fimbriiglobus ruber]
MLIDRFLRAGGLGLVVVVVGAGGLFKSDNFYGTLLRGVDAQFYYAAARSVVVSGDWDVTDDLPLAPWQGPFQSSVGVPRRPDGGIKNVFPAGLSLVEAVFLKAACARGTSTPGAAPGYSRSEIATVAVGLLLLAAVGLQVTYSLVRPLTTPGWAAAVVLATWVGTPLLYYTAWFPFSVHPTTFALMTLMIVVADRIPASPRANAYIVAFGVLAALLYLVRPHQTPYIVILAAAKVMQVCRRDWREWLPGTALGLSACAGAMLLQASVHAVNVGSFTLLAHGHHDHPMITGEFHWDDPRFDIVLMSPIRGLFWVTPIIALSLAGYVVRAGAVPWWGWASLGNAAIQTSILAFWSDPNQGESFGIRLWCEHVPVVACGLAVLAGGPDRSHGARWALAAAIGACLAWTLPYLVMYSFMLIPQDSTHSKVVSQVLWLYRGLF